jgi:hypothetical protein
VSIWRETRDDDRERTHGLIADLGASLSLPSDTDLERKKFEATVAHGLVAADRAGAPPAGHTYPRRG